jgi:hypothetical protein
MRTQTDGGSNPFEGETMRNRRFAIVLTGICLLTMTALNAGAWADKSAVGTWKLDLTKSSYGNMPAPKFEQMVVAADTPESLKWSLKGVGADGKSYISSYDGPTDSKFHRMMSSEGSDTVAYTRTGSALSWIVKDKEGSIIETGSGQLSPDGNTLTLSGAMQGPKGKSVFVSVFDRAL